MKINSHALQDVTSTRDLGVTRQSDIRFNHHSNDIVTKINRTLAILGPDKPENRLSIQTQCLAYKSMVVQTATGIH